MRKMVLRIGEDSSWVGIVALVVGLNVYWSGVLAVFGDYFEQVTGSPLLDLENVESILSAAEAQALIGTYGEVARNLYWDFFIMDFLAPPVVFGSFVLLWVVLLRHRTHRWNERVLNSPLLWLPLGVGFFDWWENLAFVTAIMSPGSADVVGLLQIGLVLVWLKAICLIGTFVLTAVLIVYRLGVGVYGFVRPSQVNLSGEG